MSQILLGFCINAAQIAFFGSLSSSATYLRFPLRIMHCLPSSMHLISAMRHSLRMLPFFASNFWSYDTNLSHNFCACIFVQDDSYFKISFVLILMTTLNRVHMLLFLSIILISICVIIWTYCISLIVQHWSFSRNNFYHW